jgi:phosphoesterase RecJ-like protein
MAIDKDTGPAAVEYRAAELLKGGRRILIGTHQGPDGDAVGSMAALGHICRALGLEVRLYCQSDLPDDLAWLPLPGPLAHSLDELRGWAPDRLALVDCGAASRASQEMADFFQGKKTAGLERKKIQTLNIDHHVSNPAFADLNWVEVAAPATAEIIARLARHLKLSYAGGLGEAIYLGLATDTGHFTYASTGAPSLRLAAEIIDSGLKVEELFEKYDNTWSLGRMQLWGELMQNLSLHADGKIVSTVISMATLRKHDCDTPDLEGFASFLRHLKGVEVSLLVREGATSGSKVSLRSMGGRSSVDVQAVAARFGGGGHRSAAGAVISFPINQVEAMVLEALIPAVTAVGGW